LKVEQKPEIFDSGRILKQGFPARGGCKKEAFFAVKFWAVSGGPMGYKWCTGAGGWGLRVARRGVLARQSWVWVSKIS
jgi:hypothetical protein